MYFSGADDLELPAAEPLHRETRLSVYRCEGIAASCEPARIAARPDISSCSQFIPERMRPTTHSS